MEKCKKVGIVGSGLIGRSWAMLFASVGYKVSLYDIESQKVDEALQLIQEDLKVLQTKGYLRGSLSADQQLKLMSKSDSLSECMEGAKHVQVNRMLFGTETSHAVEGNYCCNKMMERKLKF